jgi:hypothetical protein
MCLPGRCPATALHVTIHLLNKIKINNQIVC